MASPITSTLTITAWRSGTHYKDPHFKLLVDDKVVGEAYVSATAAKDFTFKVSVDPDEAHKIQVVYDNDDPARDLHVRGIKIDGQEIRSTSQYASYDKGAVDGIYVVPGAEGLYWGGALTFGVPEQFFGGAYVPPPAPPAPVLKTVDVIVKASNSLGGGDSAHFKLLLDGKIIGEGNATSTTAQTYAFKAELDPAKAHKVQVQFDNDHYANGLDRNLNVDSVTINGHVLAPTGSGVSYDRGALDGVDVLAGQRTLTSNGTLSFTAGTNLLGNAPAAKAPTEAAYYVAENGKDTWSGRLAAPNAAGTDGPFASLEKAQAAMRATSIDTTYVREGTYHRTKTLELTSQDNGVTFKAYPGETVVLSGGEVVKGFTHEGNGVYSAKLATPTDFDLTIGGERQRLAEKGNWNPDDPTAGWFFADAASGGASGTALRYHGTEIVRGDIAAGTKIQVFDTERLEDAILEVKAIDTATRTITFKTDAGFALREGSTFRLLDNAAHVNKAGEFAWRESDGKLVFKPENPATFQQDGVEVARLDTLIKMNGASKVTIEGFTFTNTKAGGDALDMINADYNQIRDNSFSNVGTGISLELGSSNNLITGNDLVHLAKHGIEMNYGSNANRITANDIAFIGEIYKHVGGVFGFGVSNNVIGHNDISHSARYGVSLKSWGTDTLIKNNVIEYNRITDTSLETADTGAIETLGRTGADTGTIIRGNYIDGAMGLATNGNDQWLKGWKGFGIYLDDMSGGTTVTDNIVQDTSWASIMIHGGDNNKVTNNIGILANNKEDFIWVATANPSHGAKAVPYNNTIQKNIVYGELPLDDYTQLEAANNPVVNNNLVYNVPKFGSGDTIGNPLFENFWAGDYSLRDSSPAYKLGIHDLNWTAMGNSSPLAGVNDVVVVGAGDSFFF